MSTPKWLETYYGDAFDLLDPTVLLDGDKVAVVRLRIVNTMSAGLSRMGYVLVQKNGKHNVTQHLSLHEGVPTQKDMDRMTKVFEEEDSK